MEITLRRLGCEDSLTLNVEASCDSDADFACIFVYHVNADPITNGDLFSNVASLHDMSTIPVDAPSATEDESTADYIPFYRLSTLQVDLPNYDELTRVWSLIKLDTQSLVRSYNLSEGLNEIETVTITG